MKIPVEIRADEFFTEQVKKLILQKINEILDGEQNVRSYIKELIDKCVVRKEKKDFETIIGKMIKEEVFQPSWKYYSRGPSFSSFVRDTIERVVKEEVRECIENYLFTKIDVVLKEDKE